MIVVNDVHKRYRTGHGMGPWVLKGASFTIPLRTNVGLVGRNGAGKSTLLRIIGGVDRPSRGSVERQCRVSWPMGFGGGLQGALTGRQNAKFICRIHGHEHDIPARLAAIQEFADIGAAFDEPVRTYSSGMKSRLQFGMSLAFDFDVYISDEVTGTGDAAFRKKASDAFRERVGRAGLIMVSHSMATLREYCTAGIWLHEGRAHWFDSINDAIAAHIQDMGVTEAGNGAAQLLTPALQRLISDGLAGKPHQVPQPDGEAIIAAGRQLGLQLVPRWAVAKRGYRPRAGAIPIFRRHLPAEDRYVDFFDMLTQCEPDEVVPDER